MGVPVSQRVTIVVKSDSVSVVASPGAPLKARGGLVSAQTDGSVRVDSSGGPIELTCDENAHLSIGTKSGRVTCKGTLGEVRVTSSSGRVDIERANTIDVRTTSGKVSIEECLGACTVRTTSARIDIGKADGADVASTSGRIEIAEVREASVQSVSGNVEVGTLENPDLVVRSQSASVKIAVPAGSTIAANLRSRSGKVDCECPIGSGGRVDVETSSGAIKISCR
jgi:DUF4097 and DUF4098 domain-containing protein YvlB